MGNHFFYGRGPLKGQGRVEICHQSGSGVGSSLPPPLPTPPQKKKSKKNKRQVIWAVHNLGHEEFLICEIRSPCFVSNLRDVNNIPRFLNAECRFFPFFLREVTDQKNPKKLKRRDLKNNTWAWLIVFTYFSWPRLGGRHIFIRKLRRIPILLNNNGLHRHISKQGQTNPCKMFSKEWKPLCTNPHLMLESKWLRFGW